MRDSITITITIASGGGTRRKTDAVIAMESSVHGDFEAGSNADLAVSP